MRLKLKDDYLTFHKAIVLKIVTCNFDLGSSVPLGTSCGIHHFLEQITVASVVFKTQQF